MSGDGGFWIVNFGWWMVDEEREYWVLTIDRFKNLLL
jgi:hypothetical protein